MNNEILGVVFAMVFMFLLILLGLSECTLSNLKKLFKVDENNSMLLRCSECLQCSEYSQCDFHYYKMINIEFDINCVIITHAEQDKIFAEQDKIFAEQDKIFAGQDKIFAEQDKIFAIV